MFKKLLVGLLAFIVLLILLIICSIDVIDRTSLSDQKEYRELMSLLAQKKLQQFPSDSVSVGWSKINITPSYPTYLAGFGRRGPYTAIHDSLFARVLVLDNGSAKAAIVSLDLLMFPKVISDRIVKHFTNTAGGFNMIFLGATHTHHGIGEWESSRLGRLAFGDFNRNLVEHISTGIKDAIKKADDDKLNASLHFRKVPAPEYVKHRIEPDNGIVDPYVRVLEIIREDGSRAFLTTYSAHPVNIDADLWTVSRDYPGELVDYLEKDGDVDFAVFLAGMVGSHRSAGTDLRDFERTRYLGSQLGAEILNSDTEKEEFDNYNMICDRIRLPLHQSHMRISRDLQIRDWLFRYMAGPMDPDIRILRIGSLLMLGTPCDFSGEISMEENLDQYARNHGLNLMISSFNGQYIGYITSDKRYDLNDHDEVRILNWVGPHKGQYFTKTIKSVIQKSE
jgi:hypothetical protein